MGAAEYGTLAVGQCGVQVLAAADLDQFPQAPALPPHPHHVYGRAVALPEDLLSHPLSLLLTEFFAEYQPQVARYLVALAGVRPEHPVAPPAGGTVANA
jgi:hypothetical protein